MTACSGGPASVVSQPNPGVAPLASATVSLAHIFAPYVYMGQFFPLAQNATAVSRFYTLAFVLGANARTCAATWNGTTPINAGLEQNDIANLRAAGGDVIISFGGYDGYELAQDCPNAADLEAQYQMAMRQYGVRSLDFDIEYGPSGALTDQASIERRNQALAALQAANPGLQVSYTLPVTVQGLTPEDIFLLDNAVSQHVHITAVNLMTMDYGYADRQMEKDAVHAAQASLTQMAQLWPGRSQSQLQSMLSITPMIGQNNTPGEVFQPADADVVEQFAAAYGINRLSFWSAQRDQQCAGGVNANVQDDCSGILQPPDQFASIFQAF